MSLFLIRTTNTNGEYEDSNSYATGLVNSVAKNYGFYIANSNSAPNEYPTFVLENGDVLSLYKGEETKNILDKIISNKNMCKIMGENAFKALFEKVSKSVRSHVRNTRLFRR